MPYAEASAAPPGPWPNPTLGNPAWEESGFRVLVVRLSPLRDVERSASHLFLARETRRAGADIYIDLAFLPAAAERRRRLKAGGPLLAGTQSGRPPAEFDLLLVSNSYLLELINLPFLLSRSGLPLPAGKRPQALPPIILGGSNALGAQAIVTESGDCFADALFFGEGEGSIDRLIAACRGARAGTRRERLREAASKVEGLWVAGDLAGKARKAIARPADSRTGLWGTAVGSFPVLDGEEAATARLQITYGCPGRCAFCFEGCDRRPFRIVPLPALIEEARTLKRETGADRLEILSFNFNTHPQIIELLEALNRLFLQVNWMSQRPDVLAATPGLLQAELTGGKRSFTLGIEGVSRRMRGFLAKSLGPGVLEALFGELLQRKAREIKLFYQLTGYEEEGDFAEFEAQVAGMGRTARDLHPGTRVIFSFNRLLRLPFTPLRHDRLFLEEGAWLPLIDRARAICRRAGFEFRLATPWNEYWTAQVLALGGYWLHAALERMAEAGLCYDGSLPDEARKILSEELRRELARRGLAAEAFAAEKPADHPFPLDFVEGSPSREELWSRYREARQAIGRATAGEGSASRSALRKAAREARRQAPGEAPPARPVPPDAAALQRLSALMEAKQRPPVLALRLQLPRAAAGTTPEWRAAWAARELYRRHPGLLDQVLSVREVPLFPEAAGEGRPEGARVPLFGWSVFALKAWDPDTMRRELAASDPALLLPQAPDPGGCGDRVGFERALIVAFLPAGRLAALLEELRVRATIRREGDGYRLEVPPASAKKRILLGGRTEPAPQGMRVELWVGPRFSLSAWRRLFAPNPARQDPPFPPPLEVREIRLP